MPQLKIRGSLVLRKTTTVLMELVLFIYKYFIMVKEKEYR